MVVDADTPVKSIAAEMAAVLAQAAIPTAVATSEAPAPITDAPAACWRVVLNPDLPDGRYRLIIVVHDPALASSVTGSKIPAACFLSKIVDKAHPRDDKERLHMHFRRAMVAEKRKNWSVVLDETRAALALSPNSVDSLQLRCLALARLQRTAEARTVLASLLEAVRTHADPCSGGLRAEFGPGTVEEMKEWAQDETGLALSE